MQNEKQISYSTFFEQAPLACAILDADLRIEKANDEILEIWGRSSAVIGKKLLEVMPELDGQHYPALLRKTIDENVVHNEKGAKLVLMRQGLPRTIFVDYCYRPISGPDNNVTGLMVTATDVTRREEDLLFKAESIRTLKALIVNAPVAMCLFLGNNHEISTVNQNMLNVWELNQYLGLKELRYVFHTGLPYSRTIDDIQYSYTPVRDAHGKTTGIILVAGVPPKYD